MRTLPSENIKPPMNCKSFCADTCLSVCSITLDDPASSWFKLRQKNVFLVHAFVMRAFRANEGVDERANEIVDERANKRVDERANEREVERAN